MVRLCSAELLLTLLATRALPVIGKGFKGDAIVLRRIVHISAYRADILAGRFNSCHLCGRNALRRVVQVDDGFVLQVFDAEGRVGGEVDRGVLRDERANLVERLPCCAHILVHHGQLVGISMTKF